MNVKIAPSILACDFARVGEAIAMLEKSGADLVHCDVMDGTFVPPITFGAQMVGAIRPLTRLPLDCHLMVEHPWTQIASFAEAGADLITVHAEACGETLVSRLREIKALGVKAGAVINPETPAEALFGAAEIADLLLIMSVHPGWGGQKFIPESLNKIEALREYAVRIGRGDLDIEVDGGITEGNAADAVLAGANVLVAGSAVFRSADPAATIRRLRGA